MAVPETPVHEDDFPAGAEYEVGLSGQIAPVKAESVSESMQQPTHSELGLCALAPDASHILGTALGRQPVHGSVMNLPPWLIEFHLVSERGATATTSTGSNGSTPSSPLTKSGTADSLRL
jgi:hypothetical protein